MYEMVDLHERSKVLKVHGKKVKIMNTGQTPVYVAFGGSDCVATRESNRQDGGEQEWDLPKDATHVAIVSTESKVVMVDVGEPSEEPKRHLHHHAEEDEDEPVKSSKKKK